NTDGTLPCSAKSNVTSASAPSPELPGHGGERLIALGDGTLPRLHDVCGHLPPESAAKATHIVKWFGPRAVSVMPAPALAWRAGRRTAPQAAVGSSEVAHPDGRVGVVRSQSDECVIVNTAQP